MDIVSGSFEQVEQKLTQALLLAEEKGFIVMASQIQDMQQEFSKKQDYWQSIAKQATVQERLQEMNFQAYIKAAQKVINISSKKPDASFDVSSKNY